MDKRLLILMTSFGLHAHESDLSKFGSIQLEKSSGKYEINLMIEVKQNIVALSDLFPKFFNNPTLQKQIGSLHGIKIEDYQIEKVTSSSKYYIHTKSSKKVLGMSQYSTNTSSCELVESDYSVKQTCETSAPELFVDQSTQTIECSVSEDNLSCQLFASGQPKAYKSLVYSKSAAELAVAGGLEMIKAFYGNLVFIAGERDISLIRSYSNNAFLTNDQDIYKYLSKALEQSKTDKFKFNFIP